MRSNRPASRSRRRPPAVGGGAAPASGRPRSLAAGGTRDRACRGLSASPRARAGRNPEREVAGEERREGDPEGAEEADPPHPVSPGRQRHAEHEARVDDRVDRPVEVGAGLGLLEGEPRDLAVRIVQDARDRVADHTPDRAEWGATPEAPDGDAPDRQARKTDLARRRPDVLTLAYPYYAYPYNYPYAT